MTTTEHAITHPTPNADAPERGPISPTLDRLLSEETAFSTVFHRHYSSHLAMSLVALEALGAGPEVLEATFDETSSELDPRRDPEAVREVLDEVRRDGIDAVVRERARPLVHSPATMFFHAPIRLAYALDAGHDAQVAVSLVDWAARPSVLDAPVPTIGERRVDDALALIGTDALRGTGNIRDLDTIARTGTFRRSVNALAVDESTFDDVARLAMRSHVVADDFFTLHMVTGAHSLRRIASLLDDEAASVFALRSVQIMIAAYYGVGAPTLVSDAELDARRASEIPQWDDIAEAAIADGDAHVVKLVYVAQAEEDRSGDPIYREIGARVAGLVG